MATQAVSHDSHVTNTTGSECARRHAGHQRAGLAAIFMSGRDHESALSASLGGGCGYGGGCGCGCGGGGGC